MTVSKHELAGLISTQDPFTQSNPAECVPLAETILDVYSVEAKTDDKAELRAHVKRDAVGRWMWELLTPAGRCVAVSGDSFTAKSDAIALLQAVVHRPVRVEILYEITPDDDNTDLDDNPIVRPS